MRVSQLLTWIFFAIVLFVIVYSFQYSMRTRFGTLLVAIPTAILILVQIVREYMVKEQASESEQSTSADKGFATRIRESYPPYLEIAACLIGLLVAIYLLGLLIAYPLFIVVYLKLHHEGWLLSIALALGMLVLVYGVFHLGLEVILYKGIFFQ